MQTNENGRGRRTLDARVVKQEARGSWTSILESLAPGLKPAIDKIGKHVPCPVHGGKDGFRLFSNVHDTGGGVCNTCGTFDDGMALLMWYNDWNFPTTVQEVGEFLRLDPNDQHHKVQKRNAQAPDIRPVVESEADKLKREYKDAKLREQLKRVWTESVPLTAPAAEPVRLYLARRGLHLKYALSSSVLKCHPSLGYFTREGGKIGEYPCLIALVFDGEGVPVTIHRTFLTKEGYKAPVEHVKKLMSYPSDRKLSGGYIPLVDLNNHVGNIEGDSGLPMTCLGLAEGIETALAVIEASKGLLPVWSTITASLLGNIRTPDIVEKVIVYGDQDKGYAGHKASNELKIRLEEKGVEVDAIFPERPEEMADKSVDWLDVFVSEGPEGVPIPLGLNNPAGSVAHG